MYIGNHSLQVIFGWSIYSQSPFENHTVTMVLFYTLLYVFLAFHLQSFNVQALPGPSPKVEKAEKRELVRLFSFQCSPVYQEERRPPFEVASKSEEGKLTSHPLLILVIPSSLQHLSPRTTPEHRRSDQEDEGEEAFFPVSHYHVSSDMNS